MAKSIDLAKISTARAQEALVHAAIDIERIKGRVNNSLARKVGKLAIKHPRKTLSIIRDWMSLNT